MRERATERFEALVTADKDAGGDGKWWLRHEKRWGPSRFVGVRMEDGRWVVRLWLDGKVVRIGTCDKEEDAARLADALRVVVRGEAPENFTESFVEFLGTGCDGDVPAALVQAALRRVGRVAVTGTESVGAAEARDAASSVEAKIAAAVAKPENQSLALMKLSDASQLEEVKYHHWNAAQGRHMERQGVEFVRCLALVDVENAELAMALTCSDDKGSARKTLWKRKCAAAALLGVVGLDPKKPPKKNGTGTCAKLERTPAHQHALDVASRWVAHTDAPDAELAKKYAEALAAIARDCVAKQQKKKKRRC